MPNTNWTSFDQFNFNHSGHDSTALSMADSGDNLVIGGLIAANILNPATATSAGVNLSPVTQGNVAADVSAIVDADLGLDILGNGLDLLNG